MMLDPARPVALVGVPRQVGRVVGRIINGYAYVRWDEGGATNIAVERLIQEDTGDRAADPQRT